MTFCNLIYHRTIYILTIYQLTHSLYVTLVGRKGSSGKHFKKKTAKIHEDDLNAIFLFHRPFLFFKAVEAVQLFMVFYISVAATQIIPLVIRTDGLSLR